MHIQDEQPLEVICKGEQLLGKAKAVAEQIEEQVRRLLGEQPDRSRRDRTPGRRPRSTPGDDRLGAGRATRREA
jgi:hypothetical protein